MNRRNRDFEARRQFEDLHRYRKQNSDLMKESENSIQSSRTSITDKTFRRSHRTDDFF